MLKAISAAEFAVKLKQGGPYCILDVRTKPEYNEAHVHATDLHVPLDQLDPEQIRQSAKDKTIYIICRSGNRSEYAAEILEKAGHEKVIVVEGGLEACINCGVNVVRGQGMSLERQVRLVAGVIVLASVLLGTFLYPFFYIIAGFIGAGLAYSGITGSCGLALLLAKAPWNR